MLTRLVTTFPVALAGILYVYNILSIIPFCAIYDFLILSPVFIPLFITYFALLYPLEHFFFFLQHGLPVEFEIDKLLGIKSKDDVMAIGVATYNEKCRSIVDRYTAEWETTVNRVGRWIDFKNSYKTMDVKFMESVWWVFKTMFDKGLVYRGFKVMPYSTACTTPLSNFEANLNYKKVKDPSLIISFPIVGDADNASFLAWTTTPWTLPSNLGLCVHPTLTYVRVRDEKSGAIYVICKSRIEQLYPAKVNKALIQKQEALLATLTGAALKTEQAKIKAERLAAIPAKTDKYEILSEFPGASLAGLKYVPLFDYFKADWEATAYRVVADDYVTDDSGTGVVHCAPAFGEDDYRVCLSNGIIAKGGALLCPVDESGRLTAEVTDFAGRYVKEADGDIIRYLKKANRVIDHQQFEHSYPFCWRSDTPLIYKAVPSWFVSVETIKERLIANNDLTYWVPSSVKEGRFANWLKDARDWAISRSRYWGTPIPIWSSEDGTQIKVIGSVADLETATGTAGVADIHKHKIDHLTIPDPRGADYPPMKRIDDVFDCWFESGSMPYAQLHYPFENTEAFENGFPADFIAEGLDQTRGWFYTLMVIATALFDKPAFKNLIVNGLVLAADGKKMSKSLKNYPDPTLVVDTYGADALRLYLINSPVVRAEPLAFKEDGIMNIMKRVILPWWNAFRFAMENMVRYNEEFAAEKGAFVMDPSVLGTASNVMDKWILASSQTLIDEVKVEMGAYRLYTVVPLLLRFVDQLCNWYVRTNRKRLKGVGNSTKDRLEALSTLSYVLLVLCRLMAPLTPFITETMFQHLKPALPESERADSVHYLMLPDSVSSAKNPEVERAISALQTLVELGRLCRDNRNVAVKVPLRTLTVACADATTLASLRGLEEYIREELNVRDIVYEAKATSFIRPVLAPIPSKLAPKLGKSYRAVTVALSELTGEQVEAAQAAGVIRVCDIDIDLSDLESSIISVNADPELEVAFDQGIVCAMNSSPDRELQMEGVAREVVSRVQKMRKSASLVLQDKIEVYYKVLDNVEYQKKKASLELINLPIPEIALSHNSAVIAARKAAGIVVAAPVVAAPEAASDAAPAKKTKNPPKNPIVKKEVSEEDVIPVAEVMKNCISFIRGSLNSAVLPVEMLPSHAEVVISEVAEIAGQPLEITIAFPAVVVDAAAVEEQVGAGLVGAVRNYVYCLGTDNIESRLVDGVLSFKIDGKSVSLTVGKSLFFSVDSAVQAGAKL